jgi:hypothetical protein
MITSCSTPKDQEADTTSTENHETMKGKIIAKTFVNKGGKEISTIKDLYFETGGETYFIKFMDSDITYEEATALLDQPIEIEGEIRDGLWDISDEDPAYAQSRGGLYLVIKKIVE